MNNLTNFRDLGGVKTKDGRTVQRRRLLRSGEVVGLPDETVRALLEDYSLRYIVDLRSEEEVFSRPDDAIDGVEYLNIRLHESTGAPQATVPGEKEFRKLKEVSQVVEFMTKIYESMITRPFAIAGFSEFIKAALDHKSGALLFHCYAGKDRTGVAAAILYTLLGVAEEDIFSEYMLTNEYRRADNEEILSRAREQGKDEAHLAVLKTSYEVCPEYLKRVYEVTGEKSGSFLQYIMDNMDVTAADVAGLQKNYLM